MDLRITAGGPAAAGAARGGREAELRKAAEDLEALFLKQLLTEMRKAGGATMQGPGGEIYQSLFDEELSQQLARGSDLGVARMVCEQLRRAEGTDPGA